MELKFILLLVVLGIMAISSIIIAIILAKIAKLLEKANDISQKAQVQAKREVDTIVRQPLMQGVPENSSQTRVKQAPVHYKQEQIKDNQDKNIVRNDSYQQSNQESIDFGRPNTEKKINQEVGLVFCRNCGESYLSNEAACPHCKTAR